MRIINLFGKYFLALLVIQGTVLSLIDSKDLKRSGMVEASRKAKAIGNAVIILGVILFALSLFI
ncbi:CLC_0170 family protein [Clostridium thermopalmarium]|uniref:Uncharacterized protein n=1 Tax=Clostridium thermopalmarium DSM 5974 TaxID=1121340 RepID=A0A2T0APH7_9CLOT|nr:CLC_0170 family protein [Clostridium thermopalmarium]PRR70801.1 hypothetical protein CPAL_18860 [Clostridium thermopalmarium DSM 5974]PVZ28725.1 hypothetical protein LX19_00022 [Clostridium thermopalmarium DSM 5974]